MWSIISWHWTPARLRVDPAKLPPPPRVGGDTREMHLPVSPPFSLAWVVIVNMSPAAAERITQTVEITKHVVDIEEKGVKLRLTIVDTPGFGDAVNNTEWCVLWRGVSEARQHPCGCHRLRGWDVHGSSGCDAEPWEVLSWGSRENLGILQWTQTISFLSPQLEAGGRLHRPAVRAVFP